MFDLTPNEQRHLKSLKEIESNKKFRSECGNPRSYRELTGLFPLGRYNEGWAGMELDPQILNCALRFTDLGAQWQVSRGKRKPRIQGDFALIHLHDALAWEEEAPVTETDPTDFQLRFLSQLRPFDITKRSGAGMYTYLRLQPGQAPPEIWYSERTDEGSGGPYPFAYRQIDITYCDYLDALLLTKGTYGWQYLFADVNLGRDFNRIARYLEGMLELFPDIFPQYDYTDLGERLEARL